MLSMTECALITLNGVGERERLGQRRQSYPRTSTVCLISLMPTATHYLAQYLRCLTASD